MLGIKSEIRDTDTKDGIDLHVARANPHVNKIPATELDIGDALGAGGQAIVYHGTYQGMQVKVNTQLPALLISLSLSLSLPFFLSFLVFISV